MLPGAPMIARQVTGAVAYVRKSVAGRSEADRSMDNQLAAIRALADRDGVTLARVYDADWGISASYEKRAKRRAMTEMIADVQAGSVTAVYAYALDRIARDTMHGLELWHACAEAGVPIVTDSGRFDTSDTTDRMRFVITMEMAAGELDRITKRNRDIKVRARVNGTATGGRLPYGAKPGEDVAPILAAYAWLGSWDATAEVLTYEGVPSRLGRPWQPSSVALLVRREAPDLASPRVPGRHHAPARALTFSGLVRCYCGRTLTGFNRQGGRRVDGTRSAGTQAYYCGVGSHDPRHGQPVTVSERKILPWAKNESKRVSSFVLEADEREAWAWKATADLGRKRAKIQEMVLAGLMTVAEAKPRLDGLKAVERKVDAGRKIAEFLPTAVDWTKAPAEINRDLAMVWTAIILGPDLLPVRAEWIIDPDSIAVESSSAEDDRR
jgi:DNA invertase Pin-like site-specific DNA recombinase